MNGIEGLLLHAKVATSAIRPQPTTEMSKAILEHIVRIELKNGDLYLGNQDMVHRIMIARHLLSPQPPLPRLRLVFDDEAENQLPISEAPQELLQQFLQRLNHKPGLGTLSLSFQSVEWMSFLMVNCFPFGIVETVELCVHDVSLLQHCVRHPEIVDHLVQVTGKKLVIKFVGSCLVTVDHVRSLSIFWECVRMSLNKHSTASRSVTTVGVEIAQNHNMGQELLLEVAQSLSAIHQQLPSIHWHLHLGTLEIPRLDALCFLLEKLTRLEKLTLAMNTESLGENSLSYETLTKNIRYHTSLKEISATAPSRVLEAILAALDVNTSVSCLSMWTTCKTYGDRYYTLLEKVLETNESLLSVCMKDNEDVPTFVSNALVCNKHLEDFLFADCQENYADRTSQEPYDALTQRNRLLKEAATFCNVPREPLEIFHKVAELNAGFSTNIGSNKFAKRKENVHMLNRNEQINFSALFEVVSRQLVPALVNGTIIPTPSLADASEFELRTMELAALINAKNHFCGESIETISRYYNEMARRTKHMKHSDYTKE